MPPQGSRSPKIFISYRRDDSADAAGRIYDRLLGQFNKEEVFKDVDSIPKGQDFREVLGNAVRQCKIVLVVIGRAWLSAKDETGQRRLDRSDDFVRIEVESALTHARYVIPVLVQHARMPAPSELPPCLEQLAFRNGSMVRPDPDFHRDMDCLLRELTEALQEPAPEPVLEPDVQLPPPAPPSPLPVTLPQQPAKTDKQDEDEEDHTSSKDGTIALMVGAVIGAALGAGLGWLGFSVPGAVLGAIGGWLLGMMAGWLFRYVSRSQAEIAGAWVHTGTANAKEGRYAAALEAYHRALKHDPNSAAAHTALARLLAFCSDAKFRDLTGALTHATRACELTRQRKSEPLRILANVFSLLGRYAEAAEVSRRAVECEPEEARNHNYLSWLYATCPDVSVRSGTHAVYHATRACDLSGWEEVYIIDTLAAAYAENGNFEEAVRWQQKVIEMQGEKAKPAYSSRLELYLARQPFRSPAVTQWEPEEKGSSALVSALLFGGKVGLVGAGAGGAVAGGILLLASGQVGWDQAVTRTAILLWALPLGGFVGGGLIGFVGGLFSHAHE